MGWGGRPRPRVMFGIVGRRSVGGGQGGLCRARGCDKLLWVISGEKGNGGDVVSVVLGGRGGGPVRTPDKLGFGIIGLVWGFVWCCWCGVCFFGGGKGLALGTPSQGSPRG